MQELKDIVVIYHGDCTSGDGFGAAYAAWRKLGDSASYIPWRNHEEVPEGLEDKEIYIVDFSFSKALQEELRTKNKAVVIIDHHVSDQEDIEAFPENVFDSNHSGAVLAWQYFHPETEVPLLLLYIEDQDLWKCTMPHHREFSAALGEYTEDFETWQQLHENLNDRDHFSKFISHGAAIAGFEDRLVNTILKYKEEAEFEGHIIYVLNAERIYRSILGHKLALANIDKGRIGMGIVYYHSKGKVNCSLRSEGDVDVVSIAKKYGGGGHKNAAGMEFDTFNDLPFTFIKTTD